MENTLRDILALTNDVLQSAIVIFGAAVVLYNLGDSFRNRVTRAFAALVTFVVLVYMTELLVSNTLTNASIASWLRVEWIGIAQVPAAMFHLSDALLVTTGAKSRRRRILIRFVYLTGAMFLLLAAFTDLMVGVLVNIPRAPHLRAGPLFPIFTLYFWFITAASIYNVWRARQRCLIQVTRRRMSIIWGALVAAPLGVFPYMLISSNSVTILPLWFWALLLVGNLVVGIMFGLLTLQLAYFGASSPERVVRVRLYKYLARVPLAATLVLTAYLLVGRTSSFLGLPKSTASAFAVVATVIVVEWAVHTFKRPLQQLLQLDQNPEVSRILRLSERIVTTQELRDFLESVLAAACDALRTPAAFIVSFIGDTPQIEIVVGPLADAAEEIVRDTNIRQLVTAPLPTNGQLPPDQEPHWQTHQGLIVWQGFWLRPLYDREEQVLLGLLGMRGRAELPDFNEEEQTLLARLAYQAAGALEDRVLQQEVFAAVDNLLPQLNALQMRRSAAAFGGTPALTAEEEEPAAPNSGDEFSDMVKDALSHYWGGPKLTESPLIRLNIVQEALARHEGNPAQALRDILLQAMERLKPEGERSLTRTEWLLYNILELKFVQGRKVRDVARRLAMSESDLYRKQRVAIENVAQAIAEMEQERNSE